MSTPIARIKSRDLPIVGYFTDRPKVSITFELNVYNELRRRAVRDQTSFNEQVRLALRVAMREGETQ